VIKTKKVVVKATPKKTFTEIEISDKQAMDFALAIFDRIADFLQKNKKEYEEFLKAEGLQEEKGGSG
jgi:hypothetical protein